MNKGVEKNMPRLKKPGHHLNCKLAQPIYDGLVKLCNETGLEKTVVAERAIQMFIESYHGYEVQPDGTQVPKVSLDDYLQKPPGEANVVTEV